jgi:hypothetical protein
MNKDRKQRSNSATAEGPQEALTQPVSENGHADEAIAPTRTWRGEWVQGPLFGYEELNVELQGEDVSAQGIDDDGAFTLCGTVGSDKRVELVKRYPTADGSPRTPLIYDGVWEADAEIVGRWYAEGRPPDSGGPFRIYKAALPAAEQAEEEAKLRLDAAASRVWALPHDATWVRLLHSRYTDSTANGDEEGARMRAACGDLSLRWQEMLAAALFAPWGDVALNCALDYCMKAPPSTRDPLHAVRVLLRVLCHRSEDFAINRACVFAGVVALGDDRVYPLLRDARSCLDFGEVQEAIHMGAPFLATAEVDFWLDWAEEIVADERRQETFGLVAARLYNMTGSNQEFAIEVRRDFGLQGGGDPIEIRNVLPLREYAQSVVERLREIAKREAPPCILYDTAEEWERIAGGLTRAQVMSARLAEFDRLLSASGTDSDSDPETGLHANRILEAEDEI